MTQGADFSIFSLLAESEWIRFDCGLLLFFGLPLAVFLLRSSSCGLPLAVLRSQHIMSTLEFLHLTTV
jgi:hypothetical protein